MKKIIKISMVMFLIGLGLLPHTVVSVITVTPEELEDRIKVEINKFETKRGKKRYENLLSVLDERQKAIVVVMEWAPNLVYIQAWVKDQMMASITSTTNAAFSVPNLITDYSKEGKKVWQSMMKKVENYVYKFAPSLMHNYKTLKSISNNLFNTLEEDNKIYRLHKDELDKLPQFQKTRIIIFTKKSLQTPFAQAKSVSTFLEKEKVTGMKGDVLEVLKRLADTLKTTLEKVFTDVEHLP